MKSGFKKSKDNKNSKLKGIILGTGTVLVSLAGSALAGEVATPTITTPISTEYQIMKEVGKKSGEDKIYSLQEIINNIPAESIPQITQESTDTEGLKLYFSNLGLDLDATNINFVDNLNNVVKTHYNTLSSEVTELESLSKNILAKIKSDDQSTETAYEFLSKNLGTIESKSKTLSQEASKLEHLSDLLVATYYAAQQTPQPEDEEKIIEIARTIYPRTKNEPFGFKAYDHSKLKGVINNISKVIKVYNKEKERLNEELEKADESYLVMSKEEIKQKKEKINNLIMRAQGIRERLESVVQTYNNAAEILASIAGESTGIINIHNVMRNLDCSYNRERKAELSLLILPTVNYKNTKDQKVMWSLAGFNPHVEFGIKIPYSPNDSLAMLFGGNLEYEVDNLLRETEVSTKRVRTENIFGGFGGKIVAKANDIYVIIEGSYKTGSRIETISSESFRGINEEIVSDLEFNAGLYYPMNKERGLLGGFSLFGEMLRKGMNKESTLGGMLRLSSVDYTGLKGELIIGLGKTNIYQIETGETDSKNNLILGVKSPEFVNVLGIPTTLDAMIELYNTGEIGTRIDVKGQKNGVGTTLSWEYMKNGEEEKTKVGVGIQGRF